MVDITMKDERFMQVAIDLASENVETDHGGPFGAVIVRDGEIIAKASNKVLKNNDPTAHAEVNAIREACQKLGTHSLEGCTIYTSCEPCPMCLSAIYWARIDKIFFANTRVDAKNAGFDDDFIYNEINNDFQNRSIPIIRINTLDSIDSFNKWNNKDSKQMY